MHKKLYFSIFFLGFIFACALFSACISNSRLPKSTPSGKALSKDLPSIHPIYTAYHTSENKTEIYFQIKSNELLYVRAVETNAKGFVARVKISYKVVAGYGSTLVSDSASVFFTDTIATEKNENKTINGKFEINVNIGNTNIAEITMLDVNHNTTAFAYLSLDKKTLKSRQNFLVCEKNKREPLFKNYITENDTLKIIYNKISGNKKLFVKYYNREFLLPPPPFSYIERKPIDFNADSIFELKLDEKFSTIVILKTKGIYHFVADTADKEGLTIIKQPYELPALMDAESMLKSLRFITTKQEYDELLLSDNLKYSLDKYWLKCASNNKEKARQLLKSYFRRVENSNNYFSSFDAGWKTDRGLIYLIFGPPNNVFRDNFSETWVYGDENNAMRQVKFSFTKVENIFSDNDYILNRSELYKELWYSNVDAWRLGRVINDKQ